MQTVYLHSRHQQLEVFTTVLTPRACHPYKGNDDKMASMHSYIPHWPDELELSTNDVITVLSHDLSGHLQDGHFPELGQDNVSAKAGVRWTRSVSQRAASFSDGDGRCNNASGHILQALRGGSRSGGQAEQDPMRGPTLAPGTPRDSPQMQRSPGLLHRMLSRRRRKSECQGSTNGAFEGD
ncbi:uncharacterized protein si:dkey-97a13.12 [Corythoichthys intestinalis]|uniref:uncharacterized protein si:dkey-97a13.12 n=1 Tax=Corythoichthys intestinalis TaxID=161448 RepID=UPI0025A4FCE6|nr:uncharacterized protein si:dkey-97a13.12 [Corythoichthys intestinalis]